MSDTQVPTVRRSIRWWPGFTVLAVAAVAIGVEQMRSELPFQQRNLTSIAIAAGATVLLILWWLFLSRAPGRVRLLSFAGLVLLGVTARLTLQIHGVTGDLIPVIELKPLWTRSAAPRIQAAAPARRAPGDYPQILGPDRTGILSGPRPDTNWTAHPPVELWRVPVGPAWAGFAVVGDRAITLEQADAQEQVVCRDALTGVVRWTATNDGRYATPIGGEGPRSTPTVVGDRVFTQGAAGWLQCLDLATGHRIWATNALTLAGASVPEWGFAGSPLVADSRVYVGAGGKDGRSLLILDAGTGQLMASGGSSSANYASPVLASLAGVPQVIVINHREVAAHDPKSGNLLWKHPWGTGYPLVANPIVVSSNRVLVSAGYSVGAELIEVRRDAAGVLSPQAIWTSKRLKAKFANPVLHDGFVYGLDDGILACIDLRDGSQKWKEGRYGHGQGAWVDGLYLQMSEDGELVLLQPTPDGPGEIARHRVFHEKTWNPIALAGDLLLARTDREAVCLRLHLR